MSGHSKWASIKHQKGVADARRGQLFTKLTREIIVAVREGGSDQTSNFRLRLAVQKAKDSNMPNDNIERSIKRGSGEIEGATFVELLLEGYGPGGTAILVSALTDNRNRTVQDVRNIFSRNGGNLGEAGCVAWLFDSKGLVSAGRDGVSATKLNYAHRHAPTDSFLKAIAELRPSAIIGVSGRSGMFNREVIEAMSEINQRPIIFALSNPTSKSECSAEQAYEWSSGRAVFASGSPFDPVEIGNRTFVPGQGNNAYIFPGVGLGVVCSRASRVTDEMFLTAARSLAAQVTEKDLRQGRIYPSLSIIRQVSAAIACDVATVAYEQGLCARKKPQDIKADIEAQMFKPVYPHFA